MKRLSSSLASAVAVAFILGVGILINAAVPAVPSNTWVTTGSMAKGRAGAASALLFDGTVLVTGGTAATGVTATVDRYNVEGTTLKGKVTTTTGTFSAAPAMWIARTNHTATLLPDGRVLVAGGIGADGRAMSAVELFNPATSTWTMGPPLNVARS